MIAPMDGYLVIDRSTAALLAQALDVLATNQQGRQLTAELERIRQRLRESCANVAPTQGTQHANSVVSEPMSSWPHEFTTRDAAELLGTTESNVRALLTRGTLHGYRRGSRWVVDSGSTLARARRRD